MNIVILAEHQHVSMQTQWHAAQSTAVQPLRAATTAGDFKSCYVTKSLCAMWPSILKLGLSLGFASIFDNNTLFLFSDE